VTDPKQAAGALSWAVSEMEKRYQMFAASGVRDLDGYNRVCESDPDMVKLPRIVIIVDELADLMMTAPKEVEDSINRIAAKARAAGMHLIIATQRPSVDVVTGVIKANIPSRIAFAVSSQIDSRTILDNAGAEKLLGRGDMLFSPIGSTKPSRIQGCFVSDDEVEAVVDFVKGRHTTEYDQSIMEDIENRVIAGNKDKGSVNTSSDEDGDEDPMLKSAIEFVVESGQASTSMLQRKLKLGYARAARIMDTMADMGIIGPYNGAKPREVLITTEQLLEQKAREE
jgi:S-DNA-T family DNA segregation ATPase FtsK/SpoIIIE